MVVTAIVVGPDAGDSGGDDRNKDSIDSTGDEKDEMNNQIINNFGNKENTHTKKKHI